MLLLHLFPSAIAISLIIAAKYEPLPILKIALSLLVPSSPFVVYCEFLEPLVACYLYVTEQNLAVKVCSVVFFLTYLVIAVRYHL
jgi:hypothetical protein